MRKYGIWCHVSGGVTGTRESWMKYDGERYETSNKEEADKLAQNLTFSKREAKVFFSHTVKEIP